MKRLLALVFLTACSPYGETPEGYTEREVEYCRAYADANTSPSSYGGLAGVLDSSDRRKANFKLCLMDRSL